MAYLKATAAGVLAERAEQFRWCERRRDSSLRSDAGLVRVGAGVIAGQIVSRVQPVYPQDAKEQHISGAVILRAVIGTDGRVHQLTVVSASAPSLALSALAAVRRWVYRPYLLNGVPVEVDTEITVHYNFG